MLCQRGQHQSRGKHDAAARQAFAQQFAGSLHAPGHRAGGPAQLLGGLLVGFALQTAQHKGRPVFLRQLVQSLVKHGPEVAQVVFGFGLSCRHIQSLPFAGTPFGGHGFCLE